MRKLKELSFVLLFFRSPKEKSNSPRYTGKGQSLSHASRASSLYTKEPFARGLFSADVLPTSAICRPVEACETAATQIADNVQFIAAFFLILFLARCKKKEIVPAMYGKMRTKKAATQEKCAHPADFSISPAF